MKNIIEYLWQVDQTPKFDNGAGAVFVEGVFVKERNGVCRWYFYSDKQGKLLRKKTQNTNVADFLTEMEAKRKNGHAGICVQFIQGNKLEKYIIENTQLVELLHSEARGYIFVNLSTMSKTCFFEVCYDHGKVSCPSISLPELSEITRNQFESEKLQHKTSFEKAAHAIVDCLERKLTLGKSKVSKMRLQCGISSAEPRKVWILWSDQLVFENDYYSLSFDYLETKQTKLEKEGPIKGKPVIQQKPTNVWVCDGCLKEYESERRTTQLSQEDAFILRGVLGMSKYGIIGKNSIEICSSCADAFRNH